jgi:hypothetical protein
MEKRNCEKPESNKSEDLRWNLEMYKFYIRQSLISIKEYNDKIAKLKEVSEVFAPISENLKKSVPSSSPAL